MKSYLPIAVITLVLVSCGPIVAPPPSPTPSPSPTPIPDQVITLRAIPNVVAPVRGATPTTTPIDTEQYTGTIAWTPADNPFVASTVYTANIVLSAKTGWTLTGVAANSFMVADAATVTHTANSGIITAIFTATGAIPPSDYTSANIGTLKGVPAGSFQRDGTSGNISTVSAFRMSQYEITRAQFLSIMGTDPSDTTISSGNNYPVQNVNWYHAIAFCNKLSLVESLTPVYAVTGVNFATLLYADIPTVVHDANWDAATQTLTNSGYRLPTEMEWKWAAMGAPANGQGSSINTSDYAKAFSGSTGHNVIGDYAIYRLNSGPGDTDAETRTTRPVGSKLANEVGLYDMSGNVAEWCWDWWITYPNGILVDYQGPAGPDATRIVCYGSFRDLNQGLSPHVAAQSMIMSNFLGFRVVRR